MAFTQNTFAPVSSHAAPSPKIYSYKTGDDKVTVTSAGYFANKQHQLEESDIIEAIIQGSLIRLVVGSDTSTALISNIVTYVVSAGDTDEGIHIINDGLFNKIGLSIDVVIDDNDREFFNLNVSLPSVVGSAGSTEMELALFSNDVEVTSRIEIVGNIELRINVALTIPASILASGASTLEVQVKNISGDITITNSQPPDEASLSAIQYIEVDV